MGRDNLGLIKFRKSVTRCKTPPQVITEIVLQTLKYGTVPTLKTSLWGTCPFPSHTPPPENGPYSAPKYNTHPMHLALLTLHYIYLWMVSLPVWQKTVAAAANYSAPITWETTEIQGYTPLPLFRRAIGYFVCARRGTCAARLTGLKKTNIFTKLRWMESDRGAGLLWVNVCLLMEQPLKRYMWEGACKIHNKSISLMKQLTHTNHFYLIIYTLIF